MISYGIPSHELTRVTCSQSCYAWWITCLALGVMGLGNTEAESSKRRLRNSVSLVIYQVPVLNSLYMLFMRLASGLACASNIWSFAYLEECCCVPLDISDLIACGNRGSKHKADCQIELLTASRKANNIAERYGRRARARQVWFITYVLTSWGLRTRDSLTTRWPLDIKVLNEHKARSWEWVP